MKIHDHQRPKRAQNVEEEKTIKYNLMKILCNSVQPHLRINLRIALTKNEIHPPKPSMLDTFSMDPSKNKDRVF